MGLAWQKLPGRSTGLGTHRTAYDARGGMGGALGVLGVGYAGRSQRRMRRVNRSAARLSRGGIGGLRVECVKEVSGLKRDTVIFVSRPTTPFFMQEYWGGVGKRRLTAQNHPCYWLRSV